MTPSPKALQQLYAELDEAVLLRIAAERDTLTPEAQFVLAQELRKRGLAMPEPAQRTEPAPDDVVHWTTVDRFRDLTGAIVARGALEAAGIPCFLRDENTVRLDWQISNLIGGMRLQVQERDRTAALAILSQSMPGEAQGDLEELPAGDLCPFCGSSEMHPEERGLGLRAAALWIFALPLPRGSRYWRCSNCGRRFTRAELDLAERR